MKFKVVIPARYASSRLPAKPLADIHGLTMVERVYRQACLSDATEVIVATDDQRVYDCVVAFGGQVCMTREDHVSGTDRLAEVCQQMAWAQNELVVNVQGDEPLIPPQVINQVAHNLAQHDDASVSTLCEPISASDVFTDPNAVKVVTDRRGMALYFSRACAPFPRDQFLASEALLPSMAKRHIGIYAYRVGLLNRFVDWPAAPIELCESLEQLRVLWQGEKIHVADACEQVPGGVDTPADLELVRELMASASI